MTGSGHAIHPGIPTRVRPGRAGGLIVAGMFSNRMYAALDPEVDLAPLTVRDWRAEISAAQPDLLLVESTWVAHRHTWWAPEGLEALRQLLSWCARRHVPTAFWGTDDPVHLGTFLPIAAQFDAVFTTDAESVASYRRAHPTQDATFLPFAAQPALHHPGRGIDAAARGDEVNIRSMSQRQGVVARDVFERMCSGLVTVGAYSRGARLLFGDLTISTDEPTEVERRLSDLHAHPRGQERLAVMAWRRVMREHTYAHRVEEVAEHLNVPLRPPLVERPLLVLSAGGGDGMDIGCVVSQLVAQSHQDWRLAVIGDEGAYDDPRVARHTSWNEARAWAEAQGATHYGVVDAAGYYGPHYLEDLLLTLRWADVTAAGFGEHAEATADGIVTRDAGIRWELATLDTTRALVQVGAWDDVTEASIASGSVVSGLATHGLGYCARGARLPASAREELGELPVRAGLTLAELRALTARLAPVTDDAMTGLDLAAIQAGIPEHPEVRCALSDDGQLVVTADLPPGEHRYLHSSWPVPVADLQGHQPPTVYLESSGSLGLAVTLIYRDGEGQRLGHTTARDGSTPLVIPDGATHATVSLRVAGTGSRTVRRLVAQPVDPLSRPVLPTAPSLVLTTAYPTYKNLYRLTFVHSRVRGYREHGVTAEVMILNQQRAVPVFREFEGVDVTTGDAGVLQQTLELGRVRDVLVHFLTPVMWESLLAHRTWQTVTVWAHGWEIQPWWRRSFNYTTEDEITEAKRASEERLTFWRRVFAEVPEGVRFVFVSQFFAEQVFEDLGVRLRSEQYSIIHNPVDTSIFRYVPKSPEQRFRVLSIRPYTTPTYANDLSVAAVLELSQRPGFEALQFSFFGDGPLFEETVAPLRGLANVEIHQRFLTHAEIAEQHRQHGIFLTPTRMDSQGVSRDEAMSSGLVPVTSAVAAVPEFVDETVGFLAPLEDSHELAEAIWTLAHDPELFLTMSAAASARAQGRLASDIVVPQELALFDRRFRSDSPNLGV